MLFNSFTFAVFLPAVLLAFAGLGPRARRVMLVAASYVFYCWKTPVYGVLLLISTVVDYAIGQMLERTAHPARRKWLLTGSLAANLGMLGFFKYGDFLGQSVAGLGQWLGFAGAWDPLGFVLPVGISFYTFQTLSYSIQVYRRQIPAEHDFIAFALFVSFFPQLVAGPIERASHLLPQLKTWKPVTAEDIRVGLERIISGLFMKLVIADRLAIFVDLVYARPEDYPAFTVWVATLAFGTQIYMDFAGYASIAIGTARLFGVRIVENFNHPLAARSIGDFWTRWHMTLTGWFRDYLFAPLGGFRRGGVRAALNGALVLVLCGLWHGAAWHFVAWGTYHAVMMVAYYVQRTLRRRFRPSAKKAAAGPLRLLPSVLLTYLVNAVGIVFFRAASLADAGRIFRIQFGAAAADPVAPVQWYVWVFLAIAAGLFVYDFLGAHIRFRSRRTVPAPLRAFGYALLAVLTVLGAVNFEAPYIYFQF